MSVFNAYMRIAGAVDCQVYQDEVMARHLTIHTGGAAALYVVVNSYAALVHVVGVLTTEALEWCVIGKGTNVVVSDEGYSGCIIALGAEFSKIGHSDHLVTCGAAVSVARLLKSCVSFGLSGIESTAAYTGTLGGLIAQDALDEYCLDHLYEVVVLRPSFGLRKLLGSEISSLQESDIVLEATFALKQSSKEHIASRIDTYSRNRTQEPLGKAYLGPLFPNEAVLPCKGEYTSAGIRALNTHYLVNEGKATSQDVVRVIGKIQRSIKDQYGIAEVKLLGF